ncbi:MAG: TldD/PmbA family protein [Acidobacteriota bacterium]
MSANTQDPRALAEGLVEFGKRKGASDVEVSVEETKEFRVSVRDQSVESLQQSDSRTLSLRVFVEGRTASASSTDLAQETVEGLLERAVGRARLSEPDPYAGLPEKEDLSFDESALKMYDPETSALPAHKKVEAALKTEAAGLKDPRMKKSLGANYGSAEQTFHLANSRGVSASYRQSGVWAGCYFQAGEGDNLIQDGWTDGSVTVSGLMAPEAIAAKAVGRVARLVGARKVETQEVPVVLEPTMTAWLLRFLSECVSGFAVARKRSFLAGKLGEPVCAPNLSVVDDGLIPGGPGTRPFDAEGVPTRRTPILAGGVLQNYLLDTYHAKKLGLRSNGHAGGTTNLILEAGPSSPEEILKSVEKGLLLTGTLGQGTVATTGDISVGAFGLWIEKGEIAYPVAEVTLSGNLGEILKSVERVGSDLELRRAVAGPTVKIASLTVGGKASKA